MAEEQKKLPVQDSVHENRSFQENGQFWAKGYFGQTMGSREMGQNMRTFNMKHDEEVKYNCKKCDKKISAHNRDWHDGMCDDCFNALYFPEEAQIMYADLDSIKRHCLSSPIRKDNEAFLKFLLETDADLSRLDEIVKEVEFKLPCPNKGACCSFLHPSFQREKSGLLIKNAQICPVAFNVLENAKEEFLEDIYAFENPDL
ncbi:hypothetical protein HYU14_05165 [Candidatus Woesearchaeota archaeon]|nr:hypothetical protein [Candidatus Woesearchaeota archaeon]